MPKITFVDEVTSQIGIFLALVIGIIVAQAWNHAVWNTVTKHKCDEDWFAWVYTLIATVVGLMIMVGWGCLVSNHLLKMRNIKNYQQQSLGQIQAIP